MVASGKGCKGCGKAVAEVQKRMLERRAKRAAKEASQE